MTTSANLRIGVDIGGTFTDIVLWNEANNELLYDKLLTTPDDPSRAVLTGIERILDTSGHTPAELSSIIHGTTLVANALIERKGVPTALVTTQGFRDVLEIGREWRYDLFDLAIRIPTPLIPRERRFELNERISASGEVLKAPTESELLALAEELRRENIDSVAICLLHAYLNRSHEQALAKAIAQTAPDIAVSISSEVSPELGEYERTSTTVANAYVHPIFRAYVEKLVDELSKLGYQRDLLLMLSDGRCVGADVAVQYPIRLVQSGPAAGAQAARLFGELAQINDLLCFDMGGTTAKACLIPDLEPERTIHFEVARETRFAEGSGLPLQIPAIDMIEIGAGGGSIARIDQRGLLQVGPDSAGASPGPVCYGLGNELPTVTDCDLVLGYLDANSFLGGKMHLDKDAAHRAIAHHLAEPLGIDVFEAAWGVHETVTANMAQAATIHAIERALDATRFAMLPIGGAGPVHACAMARKMNIDRMICPPGAGVASAIGMLASAVSFEVARAAPSSIAELDFDAVRKLFDEMELEATSLVARAGVSNQDVNRRHSAMMRYVGQGYEIETPISPNLIADGSTAKLGEVFAQAYKRRYGRAEDMPVEVLSWRLVVEGPRSTLADSLSKRSRVDTALASDHGSREVWFETGFVNTPVYQRADLAPGTAITGPAIVEETESTTVVPPDFELLIDNALNILLTRAKS